MLQFGEGGGLLMYLGSPPADVVDFYTLSVLGAPPCLSQPDVILLHHQGGGALLFRPIQNFYTVRWCGGTPKCHRQRQQRARSAGPAVHCRCHPIRVSGWQWGGIRVSDGTTKRLSLKMYKWGGPWRAVLKRPRWNDHI